MSIGVYDHPSLNLAVAQLDAAAADTYAVWVLNAPYPSGHKIDSCHWTPAMTQVWLAWQELFSLGNRPYCLPYHAELDLPQLDLSKLPTLGDSELPTGLSANLMQYLGLNLWQWLFSRDIGTVFAQTQGLANGQKKPLRIRLEVRDPNLMPLPWEILQPEIGKPALSLSRNILFSRTTSDVDPLPRLQPDRSIKILLVLGQNGTGNRYLNLHQEADTIASALKNTVPSGFNPPNRLNPAACQVTTLVQPTPAELLDALGADKYNVFFYAGHGMPAVDGGLLLLNDNGGLSGTELAQSLVRQGVKLAVFNACWGAQPYQVERQAVPRSSLAEVLLHHGVPAVLAMRDTIADREALSFIQTLTQALAQRIAIDEAVAISRQQLLALYKYNQPGWTLPVLYMHPDFNGELVRPISDAITEIPSIPQQIPRAYIRSLSFNTNPNWPIDNGTMRVGRATDNDLILSEPWVSQRHAEILYRPPMPTNTQGTGFYLRDFSRFGSYILDEKGRWIPIHAKEVPLQSGTQIKFGNLEEGQVLEFAIER
jgi:hypothetical protein